MSELFFYGGIALITVSALASVGTAVVLQIFKKRLDAQMEAEFGKPLR